jgi:hypothetical protein
MYCLITKTQTSYGPEEGKPTYIQKLFHCPKNWNILGQQGEGGGDPVEAETRRVTGDLTRITRHFGKYVVLPLQEETEPIDRSEGSPPGDF